MNINETIKTSLKNIWKSKLRTLLTMLGIIIGIGSVILITSVGNGVKHAVEQDLNKMGMNVIQVQMNMNLPPNENMNQTDLMTMHDGQVIKQVEGVLYVSPLLSYGQVSVQAGSGVNVASSESENGGERGASSSMGDSSGGMGGIYANFQGVEQSYFAIQSTVPEYGRFYNKYENKKNFAVIDDMLATQLFGTPNAVGKMISVTLNSNNLATFLVIGVIPNPYANIIKIFKGGGQYFVDIPIGKMLQYKWQPNVDSYYVKLAPNTDIGQAGSQISQLLAKSHRTTSDKYSAQPTAQNASSFVGMLNKITAFVGFVAAISLFVGGIGVMNIMLVTVTERTREIGIRKAIGAKNSDILFQFLIEAVIITIIGGILGIIFGYFGSVFVAKLTHAPPLLSINAIIFAFVTSTVIGIVFGVYPARKASKLNPIDALRYE
ncbi:MAG: ABC transporter permease [Fusobacteria bacterium]|nr:ABC transporter permease [Fusobacteriota bacterium]